MSPYARLRAWLNKGPPHEQNLTPDQIEELSNLMTEVLGRCVGRVDGAWVPDSWPPEEAQDA